jgi:hypothetical protein
MRMLIDRHSFEYTASIPWPLLQQQLDWELGIRSIEHWLVDRVGPHFMHWAWTDSGAMYQIGVAFRWDQDRTLFVISWC